jgi:hypothetical protein
MQLSPKFGNVRSLLPDTGEHVWPDLAKIAEFQPESSGSGQIWPDPGHFGQIGWINGWIRSDPARFRPFWPDPTGF